MKRMESFFLVAVLTGWGGGAVNGAVIYVDADATGSNSGTSWCNAYTDLSFAIFIANLQGGPDEIRVAQQTYKPTTTTIRTVSFTLHNDLEIYGGYAGCGETNPDDRNVATYVTIMSGDIGTQGVATDNSYHVVTAIGTPSFPILSTAVLDGFTITKGFANGTGIDSDGAGIHTNGDPVIRNCAITDNQATRGAGIYSENQNRNQGQSPETRNPEPGTRNPEPGTRNPEPGTRNPEPRKRNQGQSPVFLLPTLLGIALWGCLAFLRSADRQGSQSAAQAAFQLAQQTVRGQRTPSVCGEPDR